VLNVADRESRGSVPWKPITEQYVVANLGGKVRQLLVTAWNSDTGAVKVDWPPQVPFTVSPNRFSHAGRTSVNKALYEPLDPDGFMTATRGH
jgi:hypothetical protein